MSDAMTPEELYLSGSSGEGDGEDAGAENTLWTTYFTQTFIEGVTTMAVQMQIRVVNVLPGTFEATTLYMVKSADANLFDLYMSSNDGLSVRHIISKSDITSMVNSALAGLDTVQVVADITARDAMAPTTNVQVLVLDATADATVASGAATYIYDADTTTWHKISEAESMDVVLQWANIVGAPTSAVADIDDAVAKRHSHANTAVLDLLGDTDGYLTYNGEHVGVVDTAAEW